MKGKKKEKKSEHGTSYFITITISNPSHVIRTLYKKQPREKSDVSVQKKKKITPFFNSNEFQLKE